MLKHVSQVVTLSVTRCDIHHSLLRRLHLPIFQQPPREIPRFLWHQNHLSALYSYPGICGSEFPSGKVASCSWLTAALTSALELPPSRRESDYSGFSAELFIQLEVGASNAESLSKLLGTPSCLAGQGARNQAH
jgi:hypothetical protein